MKPLIDQETREGKEIVLTGKVINRYTVEHDLDEARATFRRFVDGSPKRAKVDMTMRLKGHYVIWEKAKGKRTGRVLLVESAWLEQYLSEEGRTAFVRSVAEGRKGLETVLRPIQDAFTKEIRKRVAAMMKHTKNTGRLLQILEEHTAKEQAEQVEPEDTKDDTTYNEIPIQADDTVDDTVDAIRDDTVATTPNADTVEKAPSVSVEAIRDPDRVIPIRDYQNAAVNATAIPSPIRDDVDPVQAPIRDIRDIDDKIDQLEYEAAQGYPLQVWSLKYRGGRDTIEQRVAVLKKIRDARSYRDTLRWTSFGSFWGLTAIYKDSQGKVEDMQILLMIDKEDLKYRGLSIEKRAKISAYDPSYIFQGEARATGSVLYKEGTFEDTAAPLLACYEDYLDSVRKVEAAKQGGVQ